MKHVMLIDVDSVKRNGYIHENVLPKTVEITIKRVQQTMLRKVMGSVAYGELLDRVSASLPPTDPVVPLTPTDTELIEDYIQPYLIACVDYRIIYPLTLRHRSKSVGKGSDENHIPSDLAELIRLKDQMLKDVDSYRENLVEKLYDLQNCETKEKTTTTPWNNIKFR